MEEAVGHADGCGEGGAKWRAVGGPGFYMGGGNVGVVLTLPPLAAPWQGRRGNTGMKNDDNENS